MNEPYVLGLDLGTSSVGWALVRLHGESPAGIIRCGVRVFDAGVEGDIASGKATPRNLDRRNARQQRRQTARRRQRKAHVFRALQDGGLLPSGRASDVLPELDRSLAAQCSASVSTPEERNRLAHLIPYLLRAKALSQRLEPHEIGRALYHLAQRRGFLSNRKADTRQDTPGEVRRSIDQLQQLIDAHGARTLGQYLASLDPETERIRGRWTARSMYLAEFDAIWKAQAGFRPDLLTDALRMRLHDAVFFQRPLRSIRDRIGPCRFEKGRRRAPWATLEAQRFRLLQQLNNTRVIELDTGQVRPLTDTERNTLAKRLETTPDLTITKAKKLLETPRSTLNWEGSGETRLIGNRTAARLASVFGSKWQTLTSAEQDQVVEDCLSIVRFQTMKRRAERRWGLGQDQAEELAALELEPGYSALSRRAIRKLLPLLEQGVSYTEAIHQLYPEQVKPGSPVDRLPSVQTALAELRNPIVARVLTEVRKVVNALVAVHGRPTIVRIELARDLRSTRKEKQRRVEASRSISKERERARNTILEEVGIERPSRHDIVKVLLAEECGWICPYTGRSISVESLIGPSPSFDVEHIIPFSRCFDNSFVNKTLCDSQENRTRKGSQTPAEAYSGDSERFEAIIGRVSKFQGSLRYAKLKRFKMQGTEQIEELRTSQLNDTRFASVLAAEYIGRLYGGRADDHGRLRIMCTRGIVSSILRDAWSLNGLLGSSGTKNREDHRHHALDAITIALSTSAIIQRISEAASRRRPGERLTFSSISEPWEGLQQDVREALDSVIVSHRFSRKVSGALHQETLYSPPKQAEDGSTWIHRRCPVHQLGKQVPNIVDPIVRRVVEAKLKEVGGDPHKLQDPNLPEFVTASGRRVPIKSARIRVANRPIRIADGDRERWVLTGGNHHVALYARVNEDGLDEEWQGEVTTLLKASERLRRSEPVVDRTHPDGLAFRFSLAQNETVELRGKDGPIELWRVQKITKKATGVIKIVMQRLNDARQVSKIGEKGRSWSPNTLRISGCRKVWVTPTGEIRRCRD